MKLKPIVASMLVMSFPVLAAAAADSTQAQLDAMRANVAKLQAIVETNEPGGFQNPEGWWNRITLSGEVNVDGIYSTEGIGPRLAGATGPATAYNLYQSPAASAFEINNANLYVDAQVSDYTKVHINFAYDAANGYAGTTASNDNVSTTNQGQYTHQYEQNNSILSEAYVVLGNFNKLPWYFVGGKQNVPYGQYVVYPMVPSLTQLMTQTNATAAQLGFVDCGTGFNVQVYGFQGMSETNPNANLPNSNQIKNYGANIGFKNSSDVWGYNVNVGYLKNIADAVYISQSAGLANGYSSQVGTVGGYAANLSLNYGPFDGSAAWTSATTRFAAVDIAQWVNGQASSQGAKPWAGGLNLGWSFATFHHNSHVGIGWQTSGQTAAVGLYGLPQNRYEAQYTFNISRYTDIGVDLYYDQDQSVRNGGTGGTAGTGLIRLGVKFA